MDDFDDDHRVKGDAFATCMAEIAGILIAAAVVLYLIFS